MSIINQFKHKNETNLVTYTTKSSLTLLLDDDETPTLRLLLYDCFKYKIFEIYFLNQFKFVAYLFLMPI